MTSPLGSSWRTSSGATVERESLILRLHANVGGFDVRGLGEAAPLAGWGDDKISLAKFELKRLRDLIFSGRCPDPFEAISTLRSPAARFAFSTALYDAVAHARRRPFRMLFDPAAPHSVLVNKAIGITETDSAVATALAAWQDGFRTFKLKIGDNDDEERVAEVRSALPDATLRLDANGGWDLAEARAKLARFAPLNIEYVEQPVARDNLAALRAETSVPIAADESCAPLDQVDQLLDTESVDVLVLKPSLLGAWAEVLAVTARAQERGVRVIYTTALDFAVSRAAVAQVAAAMLPNGTVCGLATGRHPLDVTSAEDPIEGGAFHLGSGNGLGISVDLSRRGDIE